MTIPPKFWGGWTLGIIHIFILKRWNPFFPFLVKCYFPSIFCLKICTYTLYGPPIFLPSCKLRKRGGQKNSKWWSGGVSSSSIIIHIYLQGSLHSITGLLVFIVHCSIWWGWSQCLASGNISTGYLGSSWNPWCYFQIFYCFLTALSIEWCPCFDYWYIFIVATVTPCICIYWSWCFHIWNLCYGITSGAHLQDNRNKDLGVFTRRWGGVILLSWPIIPMGESGLLWTPWIDHSMLNHM